MHLSIEDLCFSIEIGAFVRRSFAVRVGTMISFPEKWVCGGYGRIKPIRFRETGYFYARSGRLLPRASFAPQPPGRSRRRSRARRRLRRKCSRRFENSINQQGALQTAERRFFIVEKSADMRYNKLLNFAGVTRDPGMSVFSKGEKQWRKL